MCVPVKTHYGQTDNLFHHLFPFHFNHIIFYKSRLVKKQINVEIHVNNDEKYLKPSSNQI